MPTINDYKKATLKNWGFTGTIQDMENKWLKSWVTPYTGATNDMWMKFLYNRGFLVGPISYRQNLWLSSLGYTGPLPNKFYQFWKNGGGTGAWAAGANISYDFTKNSLPNGPGPFTFTDTHSTDILYPNSAGLYTTAGANVITRSDLGLQTVPTRTNLSLYSNDLSNASWAVMAASKTSGQTDFLGGTGAGLITADGTSALHISIASTSSVAYTSGTVYALSRIVKAGTQSLVQLIPPSTAFGGTAYANFNLSGAGSVTQSAGLVASGITALANGWYQIWAVASASASVSATGGSVAFISTTTDARAPSNTLTTTFFDFGGQVEAGSFATPLIITAGTSATVNGNQQVISGLGTQLATGVAGLVQMNILSPYGVANRLLEFNDGTGLNAFYMYQSSSTNIAVDVFSGGVSQGVLQQAVDNTGLLTIAFVVANNYYTWRVVGQSANAPDTNMPNGYPVMDRLALLSRGFDTSRNAYGFTRKLALDFLTPSDDPATKFAYWYNQAVLAAAS